MRHAFINAQGIVVQVIVGELDDGDRDRLLADYAALFGARSCVDVPDEGTPVWIGGIYDPTTGVFAPPAQEPA